MVGRLHGYSRSDSQGHVRRLEKCGAGDHYALWRATRFLTEVHGTYPKDLAGAIQMRNYGAVVGDLNGLRSSMVVWVTASGSG